MKNLIQFVIALFTIGIMLFYLASCKGNLPVHTNEQTTLTKLSDYHIFKGDPQKLIPANEFQLYELSSELFTDYAEKKRFIKVPKGYVLHAADDGLPDFPEGTIIVKTFYYYNDKGDSSKVND